MVSIFYEGLPMVDFIFKGLGTVLKYAGKAAETAGVAIGVATDVVKVVGNVAGSAAMGAARALDQTMAARIAPERLTKAMADADLLRMKRTAEGAWSGESMGDTLIPLAYALGRRDGLLCRPPCFSHELVDSGIEDMLKGSNPDKQRSYDLGYADGLHIKNGDEAAPPDRIMRAIHDLDATLLASSLHSMSPKGD
jgi:hypothetical protein